MRSHSNRSAVLRLAVAILVPCAAAVAWSAGQGAPGSTAGRAVVVIDAAHGGPDAGARLGEEIQEKDVTLAVAGRLRAALSAAGFAVVSTRDGDLTSALTPDQRAEIANRQHAVACLVIHATATGAGVHLYASPLTPSEPVDGDEDANGRPAFHPVPWEKAQADSVRQSLRLQEELSGAMQAANIPALRGRADVRPLNNLMCPALAIELAPLSGAGEDSVPVTSADYQRHVVDAIVGQMVKWRAEMAADARAAAAAAKKPVEGAVQ